MAGESQDNCRRLISDANRLEDYAYSWEASPFNMSRGGALVSEKTSIERFEDVETSSD